MSDKERDELAMELFIADNHKQSREQSVVDWEWFTETPKFGVRVENYKTTADGLIAAGYGKVPDPPRYKCEACGYPDDEADSKFWRCSLCGCLDHEPAAS